MSGNDSLSYLLQILKMFFLFFYRIKWEILSEVEWFWDKHQFVIQGDPGGEGLHGRDPGLWRWSTSSSQSSTLCLQSLLQDSSTEEPSPSSSSVHEGCQVQWPRVSAELHVLWRGQYCPGGTELFPGSGWGATGEGFDSEGEHIFRIK